MFALGIQHTNASIYRVNTNDVDDTHKFIRDQVLHICLTSPTCFG